MSRIHIVNPATGGRSFTSRAKAQDYVRLGRARFEGERLRFLPVGFAARLADAEADVEFARNRKGRVWWNGADPNLDATHLPGTASVFPKQGRRLSR